MKTKIRILRLIARMNVGGPALQITVLESKLDDAKFKHILATGFCDEDEEDFLVVNQINIGEIRINGLGRNISAFGDFQAFIALRKLMKEYRPDIIHTHTAKAGFLGRLASISLRLPHVRVHTFHGHLLFGYFSGFKLFFYLYAERFLAKFTHHFVAVGYKVRDDLIRRKIGNFEKYSVIYPGIPSPRKVSRTSALAALRLCNDINYIGWLGRLVEIKRPERLLELAQYIKDRELDWRVLVAGDGPLKDELQSICIARELPIDFLGWITDLDSFFSVTKLVLLTSANEGTPLSLIQAQLASVPVISTRVGSVDEIVLESKTGLLIDGFGQDQIQAIMKLLVDEEAIKQMSLNAREFAESKFSIDSFIKSHEDMYLGLSSHQSKF